MKLALFHAFTFGFCLAAALAAVRIGEPQSIILTMIFLAFGNALLMVLWSREL